MKREMMALGKRWLAGLLLVMLAGGLEVSPAAAQYPFAPPVEYSQTNNHFMMSTTADFNTDGHTDLATVSGGAYEKGISVFLNRGDGNFSEPMNYKAQLPYGGAIGKIIAEDFTGDAKPDLIYDRGSSYNKGTYHAPSIILMIGNGDGTLQEGKLIFQESIDVRFLVFGDFNGDLKRDLAFLSLDYNERDLDLVLLLNSGDNTFAKSVLSTGYTVLSGHHGQMTSADFNRDGLSDLVIGDINAKAILVLLGKGEGTFHPPTEIQTTFLSSYYIFVMDMNDDGIPDVVFGTNPHNLFYPGSYYYTILWGKGDGTFQMGGTVPSGFIGHFNRDGHRDLLIEEYVRINSRDGYSKYSVQYGNGDGTFQPKRLIWIARVNEGSSSKSIADLNKDGLDDLIFVYPYQEHIQVYINISDHVPASQDQNISLPEDGSVPITLKTDPPKEGVSLTYTIVSPPRNGTLSGTAPNLTYTPNKDYNGTDSFTFKVNNGTYSSNTATVSITVAPVNDGPPVAQSQSVTTPEDTQKAIALTATDVDKDPLTFSVGTPPQHGTLSGTPPKLTYTPKKDYYGPDSFTFRASDGQLDSEPATVSITVAPVNDAPVAQDQSVTTEEDALKEITLAGSDADNDPVTFIIVSGPTHGTLSALAGDKVAYTPAKDYHGPDSFTFKAND
ncbi:MAG: tandem-95 repeat protein, partial [Armatimonadetes bacterium]|nr:tandem-95 repeat protein [Armatimonadota bacterium]